MLRGRFGILWIGLCLNAWAPARASAAACGTGSKAWVSIHFAPGAWNTSFQSAVLANLQTSLGERAIETCTHSTEHAQQPLATVAFEQPTATRVSVVVELRDAATTKRILREVNLEKVPEDGRSLAVAVATDELLSAGWAELALEPPTSQVQAPITGTVGAANTPAQALTPQPEAQVLLQLGGALEGYSGGVDWWGGDLAVGIGLPNAPLRPEATLSVGLRRGFVDRAQHGTITNQALILAVDLRGSLVRYRALDVGLHVAMHNALVEFEGRAKNGAEDASFSGLAMNVGLLADVRFHFSEVVFATLAGGATVSLRSLQAEDESHVVTGVSGYSGLGSLLLGCHW